MRPMRTLGLTLCIITMAGCGDGETGPSAVAAPVGSWHLESIERSDGSVATIQDSESYTATFSADGDLAVVADCNRCNGGYAVHGAGIQISALACTRAFCGPESFFDEYTMALDDATSFFRSGDELRIRYEGGTLVFRPSP